jgi:putative tricarboxylic transport membrane protein
MAAQNDTRQSRRTDIAFALLMIASAAVTIWAARRIPRSPYDPVGSAAIPVWTAWILIALAVLLLARVALGRSTAGDAQSLFVNLADQDSVDYRLRPELAAVSFALTVGYVAAMPLAGFLIATFIYMLALGWALCERSRQSLLSTAVLALAGSVAIDWIFRRWLLINLP